MICGSCGHENAPGQKFCGECGSTLSSGPMFEEARGVFERLDARPWLERLGSSAPALDGRLAPAS